jgi:heme a synthase
MNKRRSIFEEVSATPAPIPPTQARRVRPVRKLIAIWLSILFALLVAMIAIGGMTRLTDSGLSITEWRPVTGALPPGDEAEWEAEFAKYREIPQHQLLNRDMSLAEFKSIYWWEWGHRQLGRAIGVVWALGFLWFLLRRRIPAGWTPRLLALGALGGLQGVIGWWMVSSGLSGQMVAVASQRLAVHLGLAFVILGLIAWYVMSLRREEAELLQARRQRNMGLMHWGTALAGVAFVQILLGALVAGIDAGRAYPEWPLMAGSIVPPDALELAPGWRNFTENAGLVQFNHRMVGYALFLLGAFAWLRSRRSALLHIRTAFDAMMIALAAQVAIGIATVLYAAPWQIAIVHQAAAVLLFVLILRARHAALYPRSQKIARGGRSA